jgi:hypothetical protein
MPVRVGSSIRGPAPLPSSVGGVTITVPIRLMISSFSWRLMLPPTWLSAFQVTLPFANVALRTLGSALFAAVRTTDGAFEAQVRRASARSLTEPRYWAMFAQPLCTDWSYSPTTPLTSACAASQELMFMALILLSWSCSSVSSLSMSGEIDCRASLKA